MPKTPTTFKLSGDDFDDFAPVVSALHEDGLLMTAHLGDDDKDWTATVDPETERETLDGVLESLDLEGTVKISKVARGTAAGDVDEDGPAVEDDEDDDAEELPDAGD